MHIRKITTMLVVAVATITLGVFSAPARAVTGGYHPGGAWDLTQNVVGCGLFGTALTQYPPHVTFTGAAIIHVNHSEYTANGTTQNFCRQVDSVKYSPNVPNVVLGNAGGYSTFQPTVPRWVLCWTTGDSVNGWTRWDKLYVDAGGILLLTWYPDAYVTEAVTWPHC